MQLSLYTIYRTTANDEPRFDGHFRWKFAREKTTVTVSVLSNDGHTTAIEAVFAHSNEDLTLKDVFAAFNRKETRKAQSSKIQKHCNALFFTARDFLFSSSHLTSRRRFLSCSVPLPGSPHRLRKQE